MKIYCVNDVLRATGSGIKFNLSHYHQLFDMTFAFAEAAPLSNVIVVFMYFVISDYISAELHTRIN